MEQFKSVLEVAGLASPIIMLVVQQMYIRRLDRRDEEHKEREAAVKGENLLSLELLMATGKLAYAVAMALKRGYPNGEIEAGVEAYQKAEAKYRHFIKDEYVKHIQERE